jgi:MFS family permease
MQAKENSSSRVTFGQVLKNRQFLLLWLAQLISTFGDWLAILALFSLIAFRYHGTSYQVAGIMIAFVIPMATIGPLAGVFIDRWNTKRTMISSDLIRALIVGLLALASALSHTYLLIFALSAVSCFFLPAQTVAIRNLVPKEELLVANSINSQTIQFNRVISPAIAGWLVSMFGEKACFWIDCGSFIASAILVSAIAFAGSEKAKSEKGLAALLDQFAEGGRFIWGHKAILFLVVSMMAGIFAVGAFDSLVVVYLRDQLGASSRLFGEVISTTGVGIILGSIIIGRFGQHQTKVYMIAFGILGLGLSVLCTALSGTPAVALVSALALGVSAAYVLVPGQTLMQEETPHEILGRVSSASMSLVTVCQLMSFLVAGAIASVIGIRNLYYIVAAALVAIGGGGYIYARSNRLGEAHHAMTVAAPTEESSPSEEALPPEEALLPEDSPTDGALPVQQTLEALPSEETFPIGPHAAQSPAPD